MNLKNVSNVKMHTRFFGASGRADSPTLPLSPTAFPRQTQSSPSPNTDVYQIGSQYSDLDPSSVPHKKLSLDIEGLDSESNFNLSPVVAEPESTKVSDHDYQSNLFSWLQIPQTQESADPFLHPTYSDIHSGSIGVARGGSLRSGNKEGGREPSPGSTNDSALFAEHGGKGETPVETAQKKEYQGLQDAIAEGRKALKKDMQTRIAPQGGPITSYQITSVATPENVPENQLPGINKVKLDAFFRTLQKFKTMHGTFNVDDQNNLSSLNTQLQNLQTQVGVSHHAQNELCDAIILCALPNLKISTAFQQFEFKSEFDLKEFEFLLGKNTDKHYIRSNDSVFHDPLQEYNTELIPYGEYIKTSTGLRNLNKVLRGHLQLSEEASEKLTQLMATVHPDATPVYNSNNLLMGFKATNVLCSHYPELETLNKKIEFFIHLKEQDQKQIIQAMVDKLKLPSNLLQKEKQDLAHFFKNFNLITMSEKEKEAAVEIINDAYGQFVEKFQLGLSPALSDDQKNNLKQLLDKLMPLSKDFFDNIQEINPSLIAVGEKERRAKLVGFQEIDQSSSTPSTPSRTRKSLFMRMPKISNSPIESQKPPSESTTPKLKKALSTYFSQKSQTQSQE